MLLCPCPYVCVSLYQHHIVYTTTIYITYCVIVSLVVFFCFVSVFFIFFELLTIDFVLARSSVNNSNSSSKINGRNKSTEQERKKQTVSLESSFVCTEKRQEQTNIKQKQQQKKNQTNQRRMTLGIVVAKCMTEC